MSNAPTPLHILLIHQAYVSLGEAGGTRHAEMAQHLVEQGHRVTVIASPISYLTGRESLPEIDSANAALKVIRAPALRSLHRNFIMRLLNFFSFMISSFFVGLRVRKVDLIWGTSPPLFQAFSAWLLSIFKRKPFVFEVRDLWPDFAVAIGVLSSRPLIIASEWLESFLYKRADQLLVNSPGFVNHVKQHGGQKIAMIPNGADPTMFHPEDRGDDFCRQNNLQGKFVVLYAGAHGLSNDLETVLEAAFLLKKKPKIAIVLLGDGKDKPSLIQKAQELDLFNLHFLPALPKSKMATALSAADACLAVLKNIELYKTVYPNKVFDYMAAGRPVILAIDGEIRKVIEKAGAGYFSPPGDSKEMAAKILAMAENPALSKKMGMAGRLYLEQHFARKDLAAQMQLLLEETAANT